MNKLRRLRAVMGLTLAAGLIMVFAVSGRVFADHNGLHTTPCNEPDTVGGGALGNSPGPIGPPLGPVLGFDVGSGQCNGSFTVTLDPAFPSDSGDGIELGLRIEQRSVGQVQRNFGNDYQVELGNDTTSGRLDRAWWNFQHSIAYDGDISTLDSLTFTIHTDAGPNLPAAPSFDMLGVLAPSVTLRDIIDDRNNQPNPTATFSDLYQTSQNPEFGWFTVVPDTTVPLDGDFDYSKEGAWRMTLTAEKDGQTASVSICVHTPNAQCLPDHFKGYKVDKDKSTRLNPRPPVVTLEDQFGVENVQPSSKPDFFFTPVSKEGSGILNPTVHLACYEIDGDNPRVDVDIENQFGDQTLRLRQAKLLCVPTEKLSFELLPTDDDRDDDDRDDDDRDD